eukprot:1150250-Pelagomonas_calceolata.AAC.3
MGTQRTDCVQTVGSLVCRQRAATDTGKGTYVCHTSGALHVFLRILCAYSRALRHKVNIKTTKKTSQPSSWFPVMLRHKVNITTRALDYALKRT